jgi:hypothetical protein
MDTGHQPLKPLHPDTSLSAAKLNRLRKVCSEALIASLRPGQPGALKSRPDGTILDGHHRVRVLMERGVDVQKLPREVVPRATEP